MKEAILQEQLDQKQVRCHVCNLRCVIRSGKRGVCGVRENQNGVLYALNHGKTIAAGIDPIEKKPLNHFLPGSWTYSFATVGCNLHCPWCQNWQIAQGPKPKQSIEGADISPEAHVERAIQHRCLSIAYTYSEPTIFIEYALDTMKIAREQGLKNIWVSNGYMTPEALGEILPWLDAANIDYKGPDEGVYDTYCGGRAKDIMDNMVTMKEAGVHLEVTTLVIPGINDHEDQLQAMVNTIKDRLGTDVPWHLSRFFPAWQMQHVSVTPLETLRLAGRMASSAGIRHIHLGNI